MGRLSLHLVTGFYVVALGLAPAIRGQDVLDVGSVAGVTAGDLVVLPLRVQDRAGTRLDTSASGPRTIHSLVLTLEAQPASAVTSFNLVRAGITAGLTPRFETQTISGARHTWIVSFSDPLPLTGNLDVVGQLGVQVASGVAAGTDIELQVIAATTALSNAQGTILETEANGSLTLLDGSIQVSEAGCTTQTTLCLLNDRFRIDVSWEDFRGNTGVGQAIKLTRDSGYFWFFDPQNVEVVTKTLDGRNFNDHFWVFYGALSNVEYEITVTDSVTGDQRTYFNPSRNFASVGDTQAFPGDAGAWDGPKPQQSVEAALLRLPVVDSGFAPQASATENQRGSCTAGPTTLCLLNNRFHLQMDWEDFRGRTGTGQAVPLTDQTGYFWFFNRENVEIVVKTLDGRNFNGHFWVFYGALSNVEFTLVVTDTMTGERREYFNPSGTFASVGDTAAF